MEYWIFYWTELKTLILGLKNGILNILLNWIQNINITFEEWNTEYFTELLTQDWVNFKFGISKKKYIHLSKRSIGLHRFVVSLP